MEEVSLKVKNIEYFSSQSWPFPHSLMIAYTAEYKSGEINVDGKKLPKQAGFLQMKFQDSFKHECLQVNSSTVY
jgi:NADH pyrophosphatase NudC (nudix superfamily)